MQHLHLKHVLQMVGALESVVLRSFGPEGGQVLFTRDTGQAMLSRSGEQILTALHLEHPLARMVVECVWKHSRAAGDGSKTFILLLASLLRMIHATASKEPHVSQSYNSKEAAEAASARHLADELLAFALTELDDLIAVSVAPYGFCVSLEDFTVKTQFCNQMLLSSFFLTRLSYVHCDFFSDLTCGMLNHWTFKDDQLSSSLQFINDSLPALHTRVSGLSVRSSRLIEGQVIHRDFATPCLQVDKQMVKAVVFKEYLQPKLLNPGDVLELEERNIVHFSAWTERSLEGVIEALQGFGVSVLLCGVKQSAAALALATQAEMSLVECISEEELSLFAQLSGVPPVSDCWMIQAENVATLSFCRPILLGAHRYVHVAFCDSEESVTPCSLVICAPGEGQTDQYARAFQDAIRMLLTTWKAMCSTKTTELKKAFQSHKSTSLSLPTDNQSKENAYSSSNMSVFNPGCVIPAGGTFEFLLHRALLQHDRSSSVSNDTNTDGHVSHILANALLIVPRQIYCHNPKRFLQIQTRVTSLISKQSHPLQPSVYTRSTSSIQSKDSEKGDMPPEHFTSGMGLESISCKYQLLLAVLQCLTSLLRVNMVMQTHTALHRQSHKVTNASWESTEDETED